MNLQELEKILTHAKSLGASEFECTDAESSLKVKFASHASVASLPVADEMSAEKLLYYGVPLTIPIPQSNGVPVAPVAPAPVKVPLSDAEMKNLFRDPAADEMSAEKLLYYATPYYDEILAKEEEHKKQIREEQK
jgi:hypothetical protein